MNKLGFLITSIGVMSADSECLLYPFALSIIGIFLIIRSEKRLKDEIL